MASGDRQNTSPPEKSGDGSKSRSKRKMTDEEQSERFKKTARELDAVNTNEQFKLLLGKLLNFKSD